ncbi:MAG: radical SAM protein, partial [Anaerotignum sp.]|nr:radical SAM protein [Anaerotignum sp.]
FRMRELEAVLEDFKLARTYYTQVEKIFIADGDALIMPIKRWEMILITIRELFPECIRVTSYATPKSVLLKTEEELFRLKELGLKMVYMGLESGADEVLKFVKKGVTSDEMIEAGQKVRAAGMTVSITVISGLGGKKYWREHALGSARVISAIKPEYVGFLTLMIEPGTEMYDQYNRGEIELLTPHEVLDETELFIRSVDAEGTMFRSNHASNYIPLGGTLNGERDKILGQIETSRQRSKFRPDVFRGI